MTPLLVSPWFWALGAAILALACSATCVPRLMHAIRDRRARLAEPEEETLFIG